MLLTLNNFKRVAVIFAAFFIIACTGRHPEPEKHVTGRVVGISDGDTIKLLLRESRREIKVRLAVIDAPELNQPYGRQSKQSLSDLIYERDVFVIYKDQDRYGRMVAEIHLDGVNVNLEQIRRGFAWYYRQHSKGQTDVEKLSYEQTEHFARTNRLGLWKEGTAVAPWDFRRNKRTP